MPLPSATSLAESWTLWFDLGVMVGVLCLLSLFSLFRYAIAALSTTDKLVAARLDPPAGPRLVRMLRQEHEIRLTFVIVNTLLRVIFVVIGVSVFARLTQATGWGGRWLLLGFAVAMAALLFLVGELIPTWVGFGKALKWSRVSTHVAYPIYYLFLPLSKWLFKRWPAVHETMTGMSPGVESLPDAAEIEEEITALEEERELINSIVEYGKTTVREIMVSRMDVVAIPHTATLKEALDTIKQSGHSRLPLYVEHLDSIPGILYAKDLLSLVDQYELDDVPDWRPLSRPALVVPVEMRIDDLLKAFQSRRMHIALVVDEYGGTEGIVTLEDIIEEIFGDIRDEYDVHEKPLFEQVDGTSFRVDARILLDALNEILAPCIDEEYLTELSGEGYEFETLGGLILHLTESIPDPGTEVEHERLSMTVESVDNHRIKSVLVRVQERGPQSGAGAPGEHA